MPIHLIIGLALVSLFATFARATDVPESIRPFFTPREPFRDQYGPYRDFLKFNDGTPVKTLGEWTKRRQEILTYWTQTLGPWNEVNQKSKLEVKETEHLENFTRHKVSLEIAPGRFQDSYLLIPDGPGPFPAVLVCWYNANESAGIPNKPGDKMPIWAFGYDLAKRGFVTLCIGSPGVTFDKNTQPLSFYAYCAANAFHALANRPEVDPSRIGVTGFSMGGKWALFASCLYDKFACAAWIDPGIVWNEKDANANYWEAWYIGTEEGKPARKLGLVTTDNPRTGAYKKLVEEGHDLHELHALMAPRPFLVSGGEQDPPEHWLALNHTIRLNRLLGYENRVAMTNREGHYPTAESNQALYAFFEHFLKNPK